MSGVSHPEALFSPCSGTGGGEASPPECWERYKFYFSGGSILFFASGLLPGTLI